MYIFNILVENKNIKALTEPPQHCQHPEKCFEQKVKLSTELAELSFALLKL